MEEIRAINNRNTYIALGILNIFLGWTIIVPLVSGIFLLTTPKRTSGIFLIIFSWIFFVPFILGIIILATSEVTPSYTQSK